MATPFRPALMLLTMYAEYHRDRRNILTHFIGVPMIVFGVVVLLVRPTFMVGGWAMTPAWVAYGLATAWYLTRGELALGALTSVGIGLLTIGAHTVGGGSVASWLSWGIGMFAVGWVIQLVGHYYEGRKPAFADDVVGLLVGPMLVMLELAALLGLFKGLIARIEATAGPTHIRDLAHPAV